jgi:hypothetical protein
MLTSMDAIGIIVVVLGVLIIIGTAVLGRSSGGAAADLARLMQRVPGGWVTGLILVVIGLLIIAIPWGPPPGAGPPADPGNGPPGNGAPGNGPPGNGPPEQPGNGEPDI